MVAAPYWDLSFPASLKQYIEQINVTGITFMYTPEGIPKGLCKAKKLYYVMTAGGTYVPEEFGFGYVKSLAQNFYGIRKIELIKAVGLDIDSANVEEIMGKDKQELLLETLRVLKKGGIFAIHDLMSKARYGDMEAFVSRLKTMGYADVRLIDTTDGSFMTRKEALVLGLSGSTLLVGRK